MKAAQGHDHAEFLHQLETLAASDQAILDAIQHQNGAHKRSQDLLVAILQVCPP